MCEIKFTDNTLKLNRYDRKIQRIKWICINYAAIRMSYGGDRFEN